MFKKKSNPQTADRVLSSPVVRLPDRKNDLLWSELIHGVGIFGSSSSGKTSGVGAWLMEDILSNQYSPGMMVLCVKNSEKDRIVSMAMRAGRLDDVVVISKDNPYTVNALEHELFINEAYRYNMYLNSFLEIILFNMNKFRYRITTITVKPFMSAAIVFLTTNHIHDH